MGYLGAMSTPAERITLSVHRRSASWLLCFAAGLLLAAGAACGGETESAVEKDAVQPPVTGTERDSEAERLNASQGVARRVGDTLVLRLRSGQEVRLAHDTAGSDNWVLYSFEGHLSGMPFYGIRVSYFEGSGYLIVHDSTGRRTQLDAAPLPSPSGKSIGTASLDLVAAFDPTRLFVATLVGDTLATEFELSPTDWGPDSLRWDGDDTLRFVQQWVTDEPGVYRSSAAQLVRSAAGWRLVESHR